jgi:hypothetical protein
MVLLCVVLAFLSVVSIHASPFITSTCAALKVSQCKKSTNSPVRSSLLRTLQIASAEPDVAQVLSVLRHQFKTPELWLAAGASHTGGNVRLRKVVNKLLLGRPVKVGALTLSPLYIWASALVVISISNSISQIGAIGGSISQ